LTEWQEPYESRGSSTVLWEAWGEVPLAYSTKSQHNRPQKAWTGRSLRSRLYSQR